MSATASSGAAHGRTREALRTLVVAAVTDLGLDLAAVGEDRWFTMLAGEHKRTIPVLVHLDERSLKVTSLVAGAPDENAAEVHRLLLHANQRPTPVHFALDDEGDLILVGRLPAASIDAASIDEMLGLVLAMADEHYDRLLATGFASYLAVEQRWRARVGLPPNPVATVLIDPGSLA